MMKGGWSLKMKAWVKPGLDTLNVSMTMNNNVINSVIVTADENTNPVETPIIEGETADEVEALDNSSGTETDDSSKESIVENEPEATKETEQGTAATEPSSEEENCAAVDTSVAAVDTSTESETNGLFVEEASLFNETSSEISEEFQIEGGCSTVLSLGVEDAEEMEKAIANLMSSFS